MGQSTDAILVYGIPLVEDSIEEFDEENDKEEGIAYLAWSGKTENGISLEAHCSSEFTMQIVAIEKTKTVAWRGHPVKLNLQTLINKQQSDWNDRLHAFVKKYNLETEGKPGWYLCSYWG